MENALIRISYKGEPDKVIEEVRTDNSGRSPELELSAPPLAYSMEPVEYQPYSEYNVYVEASTLNRRTSPEWRFCLRQTLFSR